MQVFSKPIIENTTKNILKDNSEKEKIITYADYYNKKIALKKFKLPELKSIVKHYNLPRTGNKDVLIERIENLFKKIKHSIMIQKRFRGWIVRYSFLLRGEAFRNRKVCVNDTDFITLEPLDEIPYEQFYSYKDKSDFIYGFNISSLIQLMKSKGKVVNPYNRDKFDFKTLNQIVSLYNIVQIIYPEFKDESSHVSIHIERPPVSRAESTNPRIDSPVASVLSNSYFYPRLMNLSVMTPDLRTKYNRIIQIRQKPVNARIQELFMEIDQLGNYTQSSWFSELSRRDYVRLYRIVYDIWNFRAQLSNEIKQKICPLFEPFMNIFARPIYHTDISHEEIQFACITIMENMIYSGVDDEYRKLGALHVLSGLTIVSSGARQSLPWLYESIAY
jgi:hypothetical protein